MKVLAIGNSFSQDSTRYLHRIAESDGTELKTVNLYIGGCPLKKHYINALEDKRDYDMEFNGEATNFKVSIKESLISDDWDVVTIQQVSYLAPYYETYQPYLDFMREYIKKYAPKSKIYLHQTWAYENGSERLKNLGYTDHKQMLSDIKRSYENAARAINADGIIPSGEVIEGLLESGIEKIHRDTFHAAYGIGRYALGLTWYASLTGKDVGNIVFMETDEPISETETDIAKKTIARIVNK